MAIDAFLKIDGIPGESMDDREKNNIEILSYSTGIAQSATRSKSSHGGGSSGRADFDDFHVVKALDSSSPKIALACANGTHIKDVILSLYRSGGDKLKYMEYKLQNCIISSYHPSGSSEGDADESIPIETISFNYGKIQWTYTQQKRGDGSGGGNVSAGWDLEQNKKM